MRILLPLLVTLLAASPAAAATGIVVEVSPELVPAEYHAEASPPYYLWPFEVRVTNYTDEPVRMVEFGAQSRRGSTWNDPRNWFGATEFTDWYTDGDPVVDGWIQPGQTAIDARSWNRSHEPLMGRSRWVYRAEGEQTGHRYEVTVEPEFVPHVPEIANWSDRGVTLGRTLRIELAGGDAAELESAQIRFGRYPGGTRALAIYHGWEVEAAAPVPGMYWLDVWAPGYQRVSVPVVLSNDVRSQSMRVNMRSHDDPRRPTVDFDRMGRDTADAVEFYRKWDPVRAAYFTARNAWREEHGSLDGFEYPTPELAGQLGAWIDDDSRPDLARFAVLLSLDSPFPEPRPSAERIFGLLPFDSALWGSGPHMAGNAAGRTDDPIAAIRRFAEESPDREVRARMLVNLGYRAKMEGDREELTRIVAELRAEYADVFQVQVTLPDLERAERFVVGEPAPEFDLPTLDGEGRVSSEGLRGRSYLLHFWATWCAPCMAEMEHLHAAHAEFAGDRLAFVSISMDRARAAIDRMRARKWPMPWTHAYFEDVPDFEERFGVSAIPALFLVDPDGVIVAGSQELREELEATLAEHLRGP